MLMILLQLALVGVIAWLILTYIPMPAPIKKLITVVIVILLILWLMQVFGFSDLPVWHYRRR